MEYLNAFLCGGALCALGQLLIDKTKLTPAKILVCYVTAGVILSALGIYQYVADWGGAGAAVPLTGFGNTLAKGVREAVAQQGLLGALTGGITATAGGIAAAIFFGFLVALIFKAIPSARTFIAPASGPPAAWSGGPARGPALWTVRSIGRSALRESRSLSAFGPRSPP